MQKNKSGYKKVKSLYGTYEKIPEDWDHSILSNFLTFNMGQSPPSESYNENQDGLPFFQGVTEFRYMYPEHKFWCSEPKKVAKKDQILFSVRAPVGEINISKTECCIGRGLTAVIPKNDHLRYCYYSLYYFKNHFIQYSQGTTYDAIDKNSLKIIKIPYTSNKDEQQKIASILSGVDALIESTQHIIEKTERLKKGLMQQLLTRGIGHKKFKRIKWLFGKEIKIPEEWEMSTIESISKKLVSGGTPSTTISEYWNGDIHWTRSSILLDPYLKSGERFITSEGLKNSSSVLIPKNNLLVSSRVSVGNISINVIDIAISQDVTGIIINKSYVQFEFLYWYLKQYIKKLVLISQGTTIKGFTRKELANLLIFLPSLSEQQKIASILSGVDAYIQKNQQYKERLEKLKKGLMQKLLTGQIRVKV